MTIEQLEALFNEKFDVENFGDYETFNNCLSEDPKEVKQFFFNELIPEVLKSIIEEYGDYTDGCGCCSNTILETEIKQKAKELGFII